MAEVCEYFHSRDQLRICMWLPENQNTLIKAYTFLGDKHAYCTFHLQMIQVVGRQAVVGAKVLALIQLMIVAQMVVLTTVIVAQMVVLTTVIVAQMVVLTTVIVAQMVVLTRVIVAQMVVLTKVIVAQMVVLTTVIVAQMVVLTRVIVAQNMGLKVVTNAGLNRHHQC